MGRPQTEYLNKDAIKTGSHVLYAAVAPASYPDELTTLAAVDYKTRTLAQTLRIEQLIREVFDGLDWKNCGALDDGKLNPEPKVSTREHHNVADTKVVTDFPVKYTAKLFELENPVVEPIMACNLKTFVNVPGTAVTGRSFTIPAGFTFGKGYKLPFSNADKSQPTITPPVGAVLNEDFIIQPLDNGEFAIAIVLGSKYTVNTSAITFTCAYTPTAYRVVGAGGISELTNIAIKICMIDSNSRLISWIVPKCTQTKGFDLEGKKYNDDKPDIGSDVEIDGELDIRLPAGFQSYIRHDEVNVA